MIKFWILQVPPSVKFGFWHIKSEREFVKICFHPESIYQIQNDNKSNYIMHTWASLKESKGYPPQKNFISQLLPLWKGTPWQNIPPF